jgi:hypothetical protein
MTLCIAGFNNHGISEYALLPKAHSIPLVVVGWYILAVKTRVY